jgi:hypothetical protein
VPKIRRQNLPNAVLQHLLDRVDQRDITSDQLGLLANWLSSQPEVPQGQWYIRFQGITVCGEGELVKTFLTPLQIPYGKEINNPADVAPLRKLPSPAVTPQQPYRPPPLPPRPGGGPSTG